MTSEEQVGRIHAFFRAVFSPDDLVEVRGLGSREFGTMRLLTADLFLAAKAAAKMEQNGANVYFTLNPVARDSWYARRAVPDGPCRHVTRTVRDNEIDCRNLYLIDLDPDRPSGTASSAEQRMQAAATADAVQAYLTSQHWPEPIRLDSGNGMHLLYRGDRCSANGDILKYALKGLAAKFNGSCKVDTSVFNAAQISRVPYTLNRKAGCRAKVLRMPEVFTPFTHGLVCRIANEGGYQMDYGARHRTGGSGTLAIDEDGVHELIDEFADYLELDRVTERDGIVYFALASCPFKSGPHRGQDVGAGKTAILLRPDSIGFKCFSDDCNGRSFVDLLRFLHGKTGRWPSMPIWEDDLKKLAERWGGIETIIGDPEPQKTERTVTAEEFTRLLGAKT